MEVEILDDKQYSGPVIEYRRQSEGPGHGLETVVVTESMLAEEIMDPQLRDALGRAVVFNQANHKWVMDIVANPDDTLHAIYFPENKDYDPSRSRDEEKFSWKSVWQGLKRAVLLK